MKFEATHTVTRNGKVIIRKGDVIPQSKVDKLKVTRYVVPFQTTRNQYTTEELETIRDLYLLGNSRTVCVETFLTIYPNTLHSSDSLNHMFSQCECLDNTRPNSTEKITSQGLRTLLVVNDPVRFG